MTESTEVKKILSFLETIGIPVVFTAIEKDCFLPGLSIENGAILIDKEKLEFPGDILHEAGHLAVVPAADRLTLSGPTIGQRKDAAAEEMMSIAWSYAACVHLEIDPYYVFHDGGYHGGGKEIADNFMAGAYFGTPMLQWVGLTAEANRAAELGINPYPFMIRWLRD